MDFVDQERITDVERMEFRHYDDPAGKAIQHFADVSLPGCPMCRELPRWKLHIANITTSMFPVQEVDRVYHLQCQCCGAVLHTRYHAIGSSLPAFVLNPDPGDRVTHMVLDDPGRTPRQPIKPGSVYTVFEWNQFEPLR